jgi:hypothetical protein
MQVFSSLFRYHTDNPRMMFQVVGMNFARGVLFTSVLPTLLQPQPQVHQEPFPVLFADMASCHL